MKNDRPPEPVYYGKTVKKPEPIDHKKEAAFFNLVCASAAVAYQKKNR